MLKMMTYQEANAILESSLSPYNYCICKKTALDNGADPDLINSIVPNAEYNRLLPPEAIGAQTITPTTYTIRFLDYDNTVLKTQSLQAGATPTPPSNPTRSGYTFSGWSPAVATVTQNQDYIATYTEDTPSIQYNIIFAEGRAYDTGIYFVMNDNSVVPVSNSSQISSSNVIGVAYLAANAANSFLIDTTDATNIQFGYPDINDQNDANAIYTANQQYSGSATTSVLKQKQNSATPMPSIAHCNNRGSEWYIPTSSEFTTIINKIADINTALNFIGASPILCDEIQAPEGQNIDLTYYTPQYSYWTCSYETISLDSLYIVQPIQVTRSQITGYDPTTHQPITVNQAYGTSHSFYQSCRSTANLRLIKSINMSCPVSPTGQVYETQTVAAGVTPSPSSEPSQSGYIFTGWFPTPYPANKDEVYAATFEEEPDPNDPNNQYSIYCNGVASGGTIQVDVHTTSVSISWSGPEPIDSQWYVTGGGSGGNAQGGYNSWGSGYVNNLNFTSTTTIQSGGFVSYTVLGVHPQSGESTSISGYWNVEVVESH